MANNTTFNSDTPATGRLDQATKADAAKRFVKGNNADIGVKKDDRKDYRMADDERMVDNEDVLDDDEESMAGGKEGEFDYETPHEIQPERAAGKTGTIRQSKADRDAADLDGDLPSRR